MGALYRFQHTAIISSLLHWLLYTLLYNLSEISTYLYDFQRVTTGYHQFFLKKKYLNIFLKN